MTLITELRQNPNPDLVHAIHILHDTGLCFSPLLECIIAELMDDLPRRIRGDIENMPLLTEMYDGSTHGLPVINPYVTNLIANPDSQYMDEELEAVLFNLLEEASFEDHFNRM